MDCTHGNIIKAALHYPAIHLTVKTITPKKIPVKDSFCLVFIQYSQMMGKNLTLGEKLMFFH